MKCILVDVVGGITYGSAGIVVPFNVMWHHLTGNYQRVLSFVRGRRLETGIGLGRVMEGWTSGLGTMVQSGSEPGIRRKVVESTTADEGQWVSCGHAWHAQTVSTTLPNGRGNACLNDWVAVEIPSCAVTRLSRTRAR